MAYVMKAADFVKKAKDVATKYKTLYVYACFGAPMNSTNKKRYCNNSAYNKQAARTKKIMAASADTFGFDCVNLLKGLFWGWSGNKNATYGGAKYASNGVPDVNANDMFKKYCTNRTSNFKNIAVGEFVWMNGHIGVYIGNGLAVECTPIWKDGVQITAVGNIGKKSGYNTRTWTEHGKSIFLDYSTPAPTPTPTPTPTPSQKFKIGDKVIINGYLYVSSNAAKPSGTVKNKKTKITRYAKGAKHPYNTTGDLGWMNEADIKLDGATSSPVSTKPKETIYVVQKGDTLTSIAKKYNTTWQKIYAKNKFIIGNNPNIIKIGQKLTIV